MTPLLRGVMLMAVQLLIAGAVGGQLLYDRHALPRVWVPTTGVDPMLPIRGRYVSLYLVVEPRPEPLPPAEAAEPDTWTLFPAQLVVGDGGLRAVVVAPADEQFLAPQGPAIRRIATPRGSRAWVLADPVAFFLPEAGPDPTRLEAGETLWAEVTVPEGGPPRPIRLEVRKGEASAQDPLPLVEPAGEPGQ
jgi:hypothetical protein